MAATLRVVLAQINLLVGDIAGNVDRMVTAARRARAELKSDLIAFSSSPVVLYVFTEIAKMALKDWILPALRGWLDRAWR